MVNAFIFLWVSFWLTSSKPNYCVPSESCWPTAANVSSFNSSLSTNALLLTSSDVNYHKYSKLVNERLYAYPSWILIVQKISDVQAGVKWASLYNIQISIYSTGHSYTGRSTANYSLMIQLSQLKYYNFSSDNNYITVSSGIPWGTVYALLNSTTKLIVGGADMSVGTTGGYLQGGGHSFLTPYLGVSCDWVTSFTMVDANGDIQIVANTSSNTSINDLFFALRGGGGSTFGVVVDATFKLHNSLDINPTGAWTAFISTWKFYGLSSDNKRILTATDTLNGFWYWMKNIMSKQWIGVTTIGFNLEYKGTISIAWIYPGPLHEAKQDSLYIHNLSVMSQLQSDYYPFDNLNAAFFEGLYGNNTGPMDMYLFSGLVHDDKLNEDYTNLNVDLIINNDPLSTSLATSNTMIFMGGPGSHSSSNNDSINPLWRDKDLRLILGVAVATNNDSSHFDNMINLGKKQEQLFANFSSGIYSNEENKDCTSCYDNPLYGNSFGNAFWGQSNYQKLIQIKKNWDPKQVFFCHHCVGDDENY